MISVSALEEQWIKHDPELSVLISSDHSQLILPGHCEGGRDQKIEVACQDRCGHCHGSLNHLDFCQSSYVRAYMHMCGARCSRFSLHFLLALSRLLKGSTMHCLGSYNAIMQQLSWVTFMRFVFPLGPAHTHLHHHQQLLAPSPKYLHHYRYLLVPSPTPTSAITHTHSHHHPHLFAPSPPPTCIITQILAPSPIPVCATTHTQPQSWHLCAAHSWRCIRGAEITAWALRP
eukprot:482898-Pelagomonas_calceolata.AAC.1